MPVDEDAIVGHTALLAETTGIAADYASGAALAALFQAVERKEIRRGSRVVLVVTGARAAPEPGDVARVTRIAPSASALLTALGLSS